MIALAACGEGDVKTSDTTTPAPPARDPNQHYAVTTKVGSGPGYGPRLCLGPIAATGDMDRLCGVGPPVADFSWDTVDGETSNEWGYTAGFYNLVGTFDGTAYHVLEARQAELPTSGESPDFTNACKAPPGGYPVVDPTKNNEEARLAAVEYANGQMDHAGLWVAEYNTMLNITFTGDIERHEREIREVWGGKLCVARRPHLAGEIGRVVRELHTDPAVAAAGIYVLHGGGDPVHNCARMEVLIADAAAQYWADQQYGKGMVCFRGVFKPVD